MKKIAMLMSAVALAFAFTSCEEKGNGPVDLDNVIEDGFYVIGEATGSTDLSADYMMAAGLNEVDKSNRSGMFEKYVALEANKEFTLVLYANGEEIHYGATLAAFDVSEKGDNPTQGGVLRGELKIGADAPAMKVETTGLYHILLDINEDGKVGFPQIVVSPVKWGVRGVNGDWGWKEMTASEFNRNTMTWTIKFDATSTCDFKFAYSGGWKIDLDDAGNVKANTNLGVDMLPNGDNIPLQKGENVTITLTWNLKGGAIANGYSHTINAEKWIIEDPTQFVVGFSGGCFGADASWSDPAGQTLAVYSAEESKITNDQTKDGTYVYNVTNCAFEAGEFKVRVNGGWFGAGNGELTLEGIDYTGTDNFTLAAAGTYDAKFTVVWANGKASSIKVVFTKK